MRSNVLRKSMTALLALLIVVAAAFMLAAAPKSARAAEGFPAGNSVEEMNKEGGKTEAVAVPYDGSFTEICGVQAYAGLDGAYWIMGYEVSEADYGRGSHPLGSNQGDNRDNLKASFKVNSTVAGEAYLYLWAESFADNASCAVTVTVNGTAGETKNLRDYFRGENPLQASNSPAWNYVYHAIPVTLIEGENVIEVAYGAAYTGWLRSFAFAPSADRVTALSNSPVNIMGSPASQTGTLVCGEGAIGLNSLDDDGHRANAGKTGTVIYKVDAPEAGVYYMDITAMAGNTILNRASVKLNGAAILNADGKDYVELNAINNDWGDRTTRYQITLDRGINTLEFGNVLTTVNPADVHTETEKADGTTVDCCNWYIHAITVQRKQNKELVLDTSAAQLTFNPLREVTTDGLVVKLSTDGVETVLPQDRYTVSVDGDVVTVTPKDEAVAPAFYRVSRSNEGTAFAGKTIDFDGTMSTGKQSYYLNAGIEGEGTGVTEGRLFWTMTDQPVTGGGIRFRLGRRWKQ